MKKILLAAGVMMSMGAFAQDVHFSQVLNNPLLINPGNVGGFEGYERAVINYRMQWTSLGSPYRTMGASLDMPMFQGDGERAHIGVGVNFYSDKAGDSNFGISQGNITIGGIVPIDSRQKFTLGIQAGYAQRSGSVSNLQWATQFDGVEWNPDLPSMESSTLPSFGYFDLSSGMRYQFKSRESNFEGFSVHSFDIGVAAYHLTQPKLSYFGGDEKLPMRFVAHGSGRFDLNQAYVGIVPFFCVFVQGPYTETQVGALGRFRLGRGTKITGFLTESALYVGASLRAKDAIIAQVMYEFGSLSLGVSYDVNTSSLKTVSKSQGGYEVSLKWHDLKGAIFKKRTNSVIY